MKKFISICLASVLGITTLIGGSSTIITRDTAVNLIQSNSTITKDDETNSKFVSNQNLKNQTTSDFDAQGISLDSNYTRNNEIANSDANNSLNYNNCANGNCADVYKNVYQNMNSSSQINGSDMMNNGINNISNRRSNIDTYRGPLSTPRYSNIDTYRQNSFANRNVANNNIINNNTIKSQSKSLTNQSSENLSNSLNKTNNNKIANSQTNAIEKNINTTNNNLSQIPNSVINRDKSSERNTNSRTFDSKFNNENNISNSADRLIDENYNKSINNEQPTNKMSNNNGSYNSIDKYSDTNNLRASNNQNNDFIEKYDNKLNNYTYHHIFDIDNQKQIAFLAFQIKEIANTDSNGNSNIRQISINLKNTTDEALKMLENKNIENITLTETQKQQLDEQANQLFEISQQLYEFNRNELSRFGFNLVLDFDNNNYENSFAKIFDTFEQRSQLMTQASNCIDLITQILSNAKNSDENTSTNIDNLNTSTDTPEYNISSLNTNNNRIDNKTIVSNTNNENKIFARETNPIYHNNNNPTIKNSHTNFENPTSETNKDSEIATNIPSSSGSINNKKSVNKLDKEYKSSHEKAHNPPLSIRNSNFPNTNPLLQNN